MYLLFYNTLEINTDREVGQLNSLSVLCPIGELVLCSSSITFPRNKKALTSIRKNFFPGNYHPDYSAEIISFLLYEPQALHTLCGIINSPHLLHFTRFGAVIFQLALRLSLLALEDLFFGQIDIITPP